MKRLTLPLVLSLLFGLSLPALASSRADRVVIDKSERRLYLYQGGDLLRSYEIALGKNPVGHKLRRGDKRTPEGRYNLDYRNPQSRFYRSIHISYPNERDRRRAEARGLHPGGNIMIHGVPNRYRDGQEFFIGRDWTEGCIAVTNDAMKEIWALVADNTPIEINP
jgi:murein L,D-transpeptidase YafK